MSKSPPVTFNNLRVQQLAINPDPTATAVPLQLPCYTTPPAVSTPGMLYYDTGLDVSQFSDNNSAYHITATRDWTLGQPLNTFAIPTGTINMNGFGVASIPDTPPASSYAVNQNYITANTMAATATLNSIAAANPVSANISMSGFKLTSVGTASGSGEVITYGASISALGAPTGPFNMGTQQITNVVDPTSAQMAATQNYVINYVASQIPTLPPRAYGAMFLTVPANTTVSGATTFVKLAGTFSYGSLLNFTNSGNNRLVFSGASANVEINVCTGLSHNSTLGSIMRICVMKNGNTPIGPATATQSAVLSAVGVTANLSTTVQTSVVTNDYLEVWVTLDTLLGIGTTLVTPTSVLVTIKTI